MQDDMFSLLQAAATQAQKNGTANMTLDEINEEISATRAERNARKQSEREIFSVFPQFANPSAATTRA